LHCKVKETLLLMSCTSVFKNTAISNAGLCWSNFVQMTFMIPPMIYIGFTRDWTMNIGRRWPSWYHQWFILVSQETEQRTQVADDLHDTTDDLYWFHKGLNNEHRSPMTFMIPPMIYIGFTRDGTMNIGRLSESITLPLPLLQLCLIIYYF